MPRDAEDTSYISATRSKSNAMPVLSAPSAVREDEDNAEAQYIEYIPKKVHKSLFAFVGSGNRARVGYDFEFKYFGVKAKGLRPRLGPGSHSKSS